MLYLGSMFPIEILLFQITQTVFALKALKSSPVPAVPPNPNDTDPCVKTTKHAVASNGSPYRMHSGRIV